MTENRRIVLNVAATYFRSLFSMACGFFISRWTLMALGKVDFGLMSVVGGLLAFVGIICRALDGANGRFYAFAVGRARAAGGSAEAIDECRAWFSVSVLVHLVVPTILVGIGYPVGKWAIGNWLVIPADRVADCKTIFTLSCITMYVGMITVPLGAMYGAKQKIAELTIYSFIGTILSFVFGYYMVTHPGKWLIRLAYFSFVMANVPALIIAVRAYVIFPECRLRIRSMFDWSRLRQLLSFTAWCFFSVVCILLRNEGVTILINKLFGPAMNASFAVGKNLDNKTAMLTTALKAGMNPAITQACGAGEIERMRSLALQSCKLGILACMLFALPLTLESHEALRLWLKNPPEKSGIICVLLIVQHIFGISTQGQATAVAAAGKIKMYELVSGGVGLLTLPVACIVGYCGGGVYAVCGSLAVMMLVYSGLRAIMASRIGVVPFGRWFSKVVVPATMVAAASVAAGFCSRFLLPQGLPRLALTTFLCEAAFLPLAWFVALSREERAYVKSRIAIKRLLGK